MNPSISDKRSRVFLTQEVATFDYRPAEEYGDLIIITRAEVSSLRDSLANKELAESIAQKLRHFDPERDYLCFSGSPSVSALVFMTVGAMHRKVRILKFISRDQVYVPQFLEVAA